MHHRTPPRHRTRAWLSSTAAALIIVAGAGTPATAAPAAPTPGKIGAQCAPTHSEWLRCVTVTAALDRAPTTGQTARLTVTVDARVAIDDLRVLVTLPSALRPAATPAGFTAARAMSRVPSDAGEVTTLSTTVDAAPSRVLRYQTDLIATAIGPTVLRVQATSAGGPVLGSDEVHVPVTIGATPRESRLGKAEGDAEAAQTPAGTPVVPANPSVPYRPASTAGLPTPHSDDIRSPGAAPAQVTCVTGSFNYSDNNGAWHPSKNLQYQVWDDDSFGDDLLAAGLTDGAGAYRACFNNDDGIGGGGQDVYVRAVTEGTQYKVEDSDDDAYAFRSTTRDNLGNGRTYDYGQLHTADTTLMPAYHTYDTADDALAWTPGDCWDMRDESCQNIDIEWEPGSTEGTYYDPGDDEVRLLAADPGNPWVVIHELGHGVMDDVYEDNYPQIGSECSPHYVTRRSGPACAWSEGFADWFGAAVLDNPDLPGLGNIDTATWGTPDWDDGDQVEGRVAGAIWDLLDTGTEGTDAYRDTLTNVWDTFLDHWVTSFAAYWSARGQDGHEVGDQALGSLFQNTIDYGFRRGLTDGAEVTPTTPPNDQNFRYDTRHEAWSVVAVRPPAGADDDVTLFDDRAQTQRLEESLLGVDVTDFVAVDSTAGRRPLGDYYPRMHRVSGTGAYTIELADSGQTLVDTAKRQMGTGDVAAVWNSCLTAGQQVTFTVTPGDPSQDAELFVVSSTAGAPATYVRDRASAATAAATGAGQPESLAYTAPADGCVGVIIVNRAGSGTYTLTRS